MYPFFNTDDLHLFDHMPCWWAPIRESETAVHGCHYPVDMVKCACLRYWPGRGFKPWFGLCMCMCAPCLEVCLIFLPYTPKKPIRERRIIKASYMKYTHRDAEAKPGRSFSVTILCFLWKVHAAGLLPLFLKFVYGFKKVQAPAICRLWWC